MPAGYRLFFVATFEILDGKHAEARNWYERALEVWRQMPGVISITPFVQQFRMGPDRFSLEVWSEIEDYGVLDRWDDALPDIADELVAVNELGATCVRVGPTRLMGDFVGSSLEDLR